MCIAANSQSSYTMTFKLSDFNIKESDGIVSINTAKPFPFFLEDREKPAVPYFSCRILRPSNQSSSNYQVSYEKTLIYENVDIEGNSAICPTDRAITNSMNSRKATKSSDEPVIWGKDNKLYGYSYGFFKITPFIYDYDNKKLYFIHEIKITLKDGDSKTLTNSSSHDDTKSKDIKELVLNPDELEVFYPTSENTAVKGAKNSSEKTVYNGTLDYLIITNEALKPAFQALMEWKIKKGLRTSIVTVETINNLYSNTNYSIQKKIKRYISLVHSLHNVKWVLLGGDGSVVPIQFCEAKVNLVSGLDCVSTPCDLYYGCLSYPNFDWDADGDGIIGEFSDNINLQQDVYVSRAPVSNATQASNFIQKIIKYEKLPTDIGYVEKMLFVGAKLGDYAGTFSDAHYNSENMYNQYISSFWSNGHSYLYDTGSNISGYSSITPTNLFNLINAKYHFIHNDTHGSQYSWSFNTTSNYTTSNASSQTNSVPSIFVTSSCLTNAFDYSCLSKVFMNSSYGAIAYFGSSRNGLYSTDPYTMGKSLQYDAQFFNRLFTGFPTDGHYRFGAVAAEAKRQFADNANDSETDGYRYLQLAINPLGDPELPIYTDFPSTFNNVSITTNNANEIVVSTGGVGGCTIALVSTDNGTTYFDVAENVYSYTFTDVFAPCYVTITKHNYRTYVSGVVNPKYTILGNADICGTNVYSVKNLPSGYSVTWSFTNPSSSSTSLLQQNTPSQGKCTISNPNNVHINEMLTATITKNGYTCGVSTMNVSTAASFSALFEQIGGTINGGTIVYPHITNTIHDSQHLGAFELCQLKFTSSDFTNCNFTFSGHSPSEWNQVGNTIFAKFPSVSGTSKQCTVEGRQQDGCKIFKYYITVLPSSLLSNMSLADVSINASGKKYTVTLKQLTKVFEYDNFKFDLELPEVWSLTVANATKGSILYSEQVKGSSTSFDTSGWTPGIYVIAYELNGKLNTKKIYIK